MSRASKILEKEMDEGPQLIDPLNDLPLNIPRENTRFFHDLKKKQPKTLDTINSLPLWKIGNQLALVDEEKQQVVYYVRWIDENKKIIGKPSKSQVLVWRSREAQAEGVAKKIFWKYILAPSGVIISDRQQTSQGQRFWEYRITDALSKGYHVYGLDTENGTVAYKIKDQDDLNAAIPLLWGRSPKFVLKTLVISEETLPGLETVLKEF